MFMTIYSSCILFVLLQSPKTPVIMTKLFSIVVHFSFVPILFIVSPLFWWGGGNHDTQCAIIEPLPTDIYPKNNGLEAFRMGRVQE
jgi:hypothetical protein